EESINKYNDLLLTYQEMDGFTYEYKIETMLNKFGFSGYYHHQVNNLSGGERTRLFLVKLLLSEPDILILDEPTNNLDIETVEFLESYLKTYKNALIIVSHDRYFINQVATKIYEIEFHKGYEYKGNYDQYLMQKEQKYEKAQKEYNIQQKLIAKEQEFINKNIVRATTTKRAQSRRKKLAKLEILEKPQIDQKSIKVNFHFTKGTGNIVLEVNNLAIGYDHPFIKEISFLIKKREKVALIGPNGMGKSTLLKTINQTIPPLAGNIKYGSGVNIAYFDQDLSLLNSHKTVIDEIWDEHRTMLEKDVRNLLGSFLFSDDDVYKKVGDLSGGEKVRLALAKLTLKKANFLILDEVTNHLDINSREVLEEALMHFDGTILFVSHDRFFINKIATKIIEITKEKIYDYFGDYNYYLEKHQKLFDIKKGEEKVNDYEMQKKQKSMQRKQEKQIAVLEEKITQIEEEVKALKAYQLTEEVYTNYQKAQDVHNEITQKEMLLEELLEEWEKLHEQQNP
ncbi:MAG TPA: ABC-F family ATP-binding cassette domain-containing protein, partial [Haloplasmataceae bacterium]